MFGCHIYNNKSKVILLKSGHYRRIVDFTSDDIEMLSIKEKVLSCINSLDTSCCINNNNNEIFINSYDNIEVYDCDTVDIVNNDITTSDHKCVDKECIELDIKINLDHNNDIFQSTYNETSESTKSEKNSTMYIDSTKNEKIFEINIIKAESDMNIDKHDKMNIEPGVKVLFYINSKESPIGVIAKINTEKGIITIERNCMTRFFPIKLITKLVTDRKDVEKYKEKLYKNKGNLEHCIVIHARNFQNPIGIEFQNKIIKQKFINNLTMSRYNTNGVTPNRIDII
ncbi:hypothetical protein BMR1_02g01505 [Babesia microti strain RI]|uniref:Uncharacterized protein n=1 Tax=Babesia microti (strain RI) TaxID=1133968 RepID=I7J643_BABMR|nr:hypothetical protein BMR1_02g01505 [Babesia microti strain RI]CCF73462.1 hypothetical protein BMR1_02g01505 [Babesia microti strain RI]|eukprot:XP_012648071.1 hypothetical protein BMR1_02g01505 [Babesia microti strain RI]